MELVVTWVAESAPRAEGRRRYRVFALMLLTLSLGVMALPPAIAVLALAGWLK